MIAILGAFLFVSPAILLSGFATPIENMPGWLQPLTLVNPLRYFLVIARGVFLQALPPAEILRNALPLLAIALVTLASAAGCFAESWTRCHPPRIESKRSATV
ncbi:MAG TPA: ABC transporter permease [Polyangiales bacterium]|nr:ABC transporter permease [Polyangiales bacterium]